MIIAKKNTPKPGRAKKRIPPVLKKTMRRLSRSNGYLFERKPKINRSNLATLIRNIDDCGAPIPLSAKCVHVALRYLNNNRDAKSSTKVFGVGVSDTFDKELLIKIVRIAYAAHRDRWTDVMDRADKIGKRDAEQQRLETGQHARQINLVKIKGFKRVSIDRRKKNFAKEEGKRIRLDRGCNSNLDKQAKKYEIFYKKFTFEKYHHFDVVWHELPRSFRKSLVNKEYTLKQNRKP